MGEANSDSESIVTITVDELALLIISSIHTLNFFTKLNHLKIIFLILHQKIQETRNIYIIILLLDNIIIYLFILFI